VPARDGAAVGVEALVVGCHPHAVAPRQHLHGERLNPYGGAIACGHPLAATGVRLMAQLAYGFGERPKERYGLTALCVGMGMGAALVWENMRG
jgi:acetyl-CoA acetyltransferase